ncbi:MAG: rhodanese-like domain-containing protein, partial [Hyphomicrobiales bacterium]|nr:rhodanese-like domain-containing protein [Hyphomicrobiales bacterium]
MTQNIVHGYRKLVDEAMARVTTLPAAEAVAMHGRGDVQFVDLREPKEREREGALPGALNCPRGLLEFWIDPASPYARAEFAADKTFVFFCAAGWRSALAADAAQHMGL